MHLFFIRHFNDVDHFTPIVWSMHNKKIPVAVYCLNPKYDIKGDYRLKFLKKRGVKVAHIYDAHPSLLGIYHYYLRSIIRICFFLSAKISNINNRSFASYFSYFNDFFLNKGKKYFKRSKKNIYSVSWAKSFLNKSGATAICFDWIRPHKYVVPVLRKAANDMSIPVLSLPHGVFLYTNKHITIGSSEREKVVRFEKYNCFDKVAVQNKLHKEVIINSGVSPSKIEVIGSARYCDEWTEVNRKIIPRLITLDNLGYKNKLKVVFMTTRPNYRINIERTETTFNMLSNLKDFEVVIKPHTRTGIEAKMYRNVKLTEVSNMSSVELCEWADVVLVIASSIIIESLKMNKPSLYLKYLHKNTVEYEEFESCWTINSDEELKTALISLQHEKESIPYNQENVNRFLNEIIYGGQEKRDVLMDYELFITSGGEYQVNS